MLRRNGFLFLIALLLTIPIVNCSSTPHHKSIPAISGTLPNGFVDVPYTGTLNVTGGVAPFTWTITGLPGTLTFASSGNTVTISGTPTDTGTINGSATVTDSKGNSSPAFPFTIIIGPTPTLTITPTTITFMDGTPVNQVLTVSPATVGPYTWNIDAGALPPGSPALVLSNGTTTDPKTIQTTTNTVTITGTPNTPGTFPFTITVTDSATPTANTAQAHYTGVVTASNANACPAGSNNAGLPTGTSYAFLLRGVNSADDQPIVIAGSFTSNGDGTITAGDVDYNGTTLGPQDPGSNLDLVDSSYSFDLNNDTRGCLSLVFNAAAAAKRGNASKSQARSAKRTNLRLRHANQPRPQQVAPTVPTRVVFQFALGGLKAGIYTTGNIIEFDNADGMTNSWASGVMHVQDSTAFNIGSLAGNFAFGAAGWDAGVNRTAVAGSFTYTNTTGNIPSLTADFNDNGTISNDATGGSGVINSISATTGRGTANFIIPGNTTFDAVIYVINANDFYIISSDAVSATVPLLSGRALATQSSFASGALDAFFLAASEGFDATNFVNIVTIGTAQFSSTGNTATASFTTSDAGTVTDTAFTGTYAVDASSGRVQFTATGTENPPVVYLTNGGDGIEQIQGFSVGQDANVDSGVLIFQSSAAPAFTSSSVAGTYAFGNWEDVDFQNGSQSGVATLASTTPTTGTYSAVEDLNPFAPADGVTFLSPDTPVNGGIFAIDASGDGAGTITVGADTYFFVTNGQQIFSIIPTANPGPDAILGVYTDAVAP